jgi:hypothetical protein
MAIVKPAVALQGPYLPQTIMGGPIIDASIFGNRELYPGQTAPIQVVIQNGGILEGFIGYETPQPYPVTLTVSLPLDSQVPDPGNNSSAGNNGTDTGSAATPTPTATAQYNSPGSGGIPAGYGLESLAGMSGGGLVSMTQTVCPPYDDFSVNAGLNIDIAATTALGVTARLSTYGTPVEIVSGDCVVGGSLPAGSVSPPFTFILRVDRGARPGVYALPLTVTYKHLAGEYDLKSAFGGLACYNNYVEDCVTLPIYVVIRDAFDLVVRVAGCENMVPGSDGIVTLKVSNVGGICAGESVVYLIPSLPGPPQDGSPPYTEALLAPSMVLPVQSSQFLGRMDPGDERLLNFKVAISPDAEAGMYPLSALVSYTDAWGQQKSSNVDTFGVPVQPEMRFAAEETPLIIKCGRSCEALLNLTNAGPETANDAVVRVNALDPFVVSYDTAYLGDVEPGDSVNATFGIKVKPDAVPTTYYVTMEVKYYDDKDDPHVTKIIRKAIVVTPPPTLWDNILENWPLAAGIGAVALLGLLYAGRNLLKRRPGNKPPQALPPATIQEKK